MGTNFLLRNDQILEVKGNGYRMGVTMVLNADIENYSVTNGNFYGFKVKQASNSTTTICLVLIT